tara:strand:+ start:28 stop:204 length:177 start_codon:yes stop_codon:yes gene_type:complete
MGIDVKSSFIMDFYIDVVWQAGIVDCLDSNASQNLEVRRKVRGEVDAKGVESIQGFIR